MPGACPARRLVRMETTPRTRTTTAFFVQAAVAFGAALLAVVLGICYLPVDT